MEKEFIVSIFGDSSVGKSSLLERYKPVCPFCSFQEALKLFQEEKLKKKEEKKDKEEEEDYETKAKQTATQQSNWSFAENKEPQSLKWYCRHAIISKGIPRKDWLLPKDLVEYLDEIKASNCPNCKTVSVRYMASTTKPAYFAKDWEYNGVIKPLKFIDTPSWNSMKTQFYDIFQFLVIKCPVLVLVYDISRRHTFLLLEDILDTVEKIYSSIQTSNNRTNLAQPFLIIIGCKSDKEFCRQVNIEEATEFAKKHNAFYQECSTIDLNFTSTKIFQEFFYNVQNKKYPNSTYFGYLFSKCCIS